MLEPLHWIARSVSVFFCWRLYLNYVPLIEVDKSGGLICFGDYESISAAHEMMRVIFTSHLVGTLHCSTIFSYLSYSLHIAINDNFPSLPYPFFLIAFLFSLSFSVSVEQKETICYLWKYRNKPLDPPKGTGVPMLSLPHGNFSQSHHSAPPMNGSSFSWTGKSLSFFWNTRDLFEHSLLQKILGRVDLLKMKVAGLCSPKLVKNSVNKTRLWANPQILLPDCYLSSRCRYIQISYIFEAFL